MNIRILLAAMPCAVVMATTATAQSLTDCLRAAEAESPTLAAAWHRLEASEAAYQSARSGFYPTVTLSGGYTRTDNPPQAFFMELNQRQASLLEDFNNPDDTDNVRGSIGFRWLLLDAGRRGLMSDAAASSQEVAAALLDAARHDVSFQVTRAFYSTLQAAALVEVRQETLASLEENLRVARERVAAGSAIKTDVLNLEVQLAEAREQLIRAENGVRLAVAALNTAIGRDLVTDAASLTASAIASDDTAPATPDPATFEARPEWRAAEAQARAAGLQATAARRERWPKVSAFGSVDADSDHLDDMENSYLVGAVVELDVFTGFRTDAGIAAAKAAALEAEARRDQVRQQLAFDIKQSHLQAEEARARREAARQSLASAEEALRITRERYQQGAADLTELLTAQVGLTANRTRAVAADYDVLIAAANRQRAQGINLFPHPQP